MKIRETRSMTSMTTEERQELTVESIEELDDMYARGLIEQHAYFLKKRALIKLL